MVSFFRYALCSLFLFSFDVKSVTIFNRERRLQYPSQTVPERVLCVKGSRADFLVYTSRSLSNEALFRVWPSVWFVKMVRRGCCHGLF